jgi:hypothetical protein
LAFAVLLLTRAAAGYAQERGLPALSATDYTDEAALA